MQECARCKFQLCQVCWGWLCAAGKDVPEVFGFVPVPGLIADADGILVTTGECGRPLLSGSDDDENDHPGGMQGIKPMTMNWYPCNKVITLRRATWVEMTTTLTTQFLSNWLLLSAKSSKCGSLSMMSKSLGSTGARMRKRRYWRTAFVDSAYSRVQACADCWSCLELHGPKRLHAELTDILLHTCFKGKVILLHCSPVSESASLILLASSSSASLPHFWMPRWAENWLSQCQEDAHVLVLFCLVCLVQ